MHHRTPRRALTTALTLTLAALIAAPAHAESREGVGVEAPMPTRAGEHTHGGQTKQHTQNLVGAKALTALAVTRGHDGEAAGATPHYGVSVYYERELVADWLELELNVATLTAPEGLHLPVDLLFKKPFHVSRHVTPYLAVGPALEARFEAARSIAGGVTAATGVYIWFTRYFGIDLEIDYTLLKTGEGLEHVPALGFGPAAHF